MKLFYESSYLYIDSTTLYLPTQFQLIVLCPNSHRGSRIGPHCHVPKMGIIWDGLHPTPTTLRPVGSHLCSGLTAGPGMAVHRASFLPIEWQIAFC